MKILISGSSNECSLASSFSRVLVSLGHEVVRFSDEETYSKSFPVLKNRITNKIFWRIFSRPLNREFLELAIKEKPDFILVCKGQFYSYSTLCKIRERLPATKIFNYAPDDFKNPLNTSSRLLGSVVAYDVIFTPREFAVPEILKLGVKRAVYLPFALDNYLHFPVSPSKEERERYGSDLVFIGTYEKERAGILEKLADYNLAVWGNDWQKLPTNSVLRKRVKFQDVNGSEMSKVLCSSRIALGFLRKKNRDSHTMRTFEIPGVGAFMLHERTAEAQCFFREGVEAEFFDTVEELRKKIDFYLDHEDVRLRVSKAGYARVINSGYTYLDRVKNILAVYEELKKQNGN